jgi:hypothetical protein
MFEKARVAFTRKEIFGPKFRPAIDPCFCTVSKMLYAGLINPDGTIDVDKAGVISKQQLWCYVYYLWFHNHTNVPIFKSMKSPDNGKATATLFYSAVTAFVEGVNDDDDAEKPKPFDTTTLILFINQVLEEFQHQIVNPIFDYLKMLLQRDVVTRLSGVGIITGKNNSSDGKNPNITIVTDPKEVENANVKITFSRKNA